MDLYYQNETLYVDVNSLINEEDLVLLKRRIFRIIELYDVDNIVIRNLSHHFQNRFFLNQIKHEYANKYSGKLYIK